MHSTFWPTQAHALRSAGARNRKASRPRHKHRFISKDCDKVFEAYRELVEQVASDAFDAEVSVDEAGCVLLVGPSA
jgi:hypothetical protein